MCGRFTAYYSWSELHALYRLSDAQPKLNLEQRYNIAPTMQVLAIRDGDDGRHADFMRWGLIPSWWKDDNKKMPSTFNARGDTVAEKPMFRSAYKARRCIVPASGFFEWKKDGDKKRPFHITRTDGGIMSFAGLWEARTVDGAEQLSCTIITTDANETMASIHNRMPVILEPDQIPDWLTGAGGEEMLAPSTADAIRATEVSTYVSNVRNQGEECVAPLR